MSDIASVLRSLMDRLLSIFAVLDLSFFLPGGVALLALLFVHDAHVPLVAIQNSPLVVGPVVVLMAYVLGLVCFGLGRRMRRFGTGLALEPPAERATVGGKLEAALASHGLAADPAFAAYFALPAGTAEERTRRRRAFDLLYASLWADLRQDDRLRPSLDLLQSYWVRAAIYDGMWIAIALWIPVLVWLGGDPVVPEGSGPAAVVASLDGWARGMLIGGACVAIGVCVNEAANCDEYQVDELAGTIAWRARNPPPTAT